MQQALTLAGIMIVWTMFRSFTCTPQYHSTAQKEEYLDSLPTKGQMSPQSRKFHLYSGRMHVSLNETTTFMSIHVFYGIGETLYYILSIGPTCSSTVTFKMQRMSL